MLSDIYTALASILTPVHSETKGCLTGCRFCSTTQSSQWDYGDICRACRRKTTALEKDLNTHGINGKQKKCFKCGETWSVLLLRNVDCLCAKCYEIEHDERDKKTMKEWRVNNKDKVKEYRRNYRRKSRRHVISVSLRKKKLKQCTPPWINKEELISIFLNTPKGYSVDHIIPISHPDICGLNVPWNLQYLTKEENSQIKLNQFDYTYENNSWKKK